MKCCICQENSEENLYFRKLNFGPTPEFEEKLRHTYNKKPEAFGNRDNRIRDTHPWSVIYLPHELPLTDPFIISDVPDTGIDPNDMLIDFVRICPVGICNRCTTKILRDVDLGMFYRITDIISDPFIQGKIIMHRLDNHIKCLNLKEMNKEIWNEISFMTITIYISITNDIIIGTNIQKSVLDGIIDIAKEIRSEGIEGRRIGTSFVIGDSDNVILHSKETVLNPFRGYNKNITDSETKNNIKAFSQLDGSFIISNDGIVKNVGILTSADIRCVSLDYGFSRHYSIASITNETKSIGVVLSQNGAISVYKRGKICGKI